MGLKALLTQGRRLTCLLDRAEESASLACQVLHELLGLGVSRRNPGNRIDRNVPTSVELINLVEDLSCSAIWLRHRGSVWLPRCQEIYLRKISAVMQGVLP